MHAKDSPKTVKGQEADNLEVALEYAREGRRVIPLRYQDETLKNGEIRKAKSPRWTDYASKATTDEETIRRVWEKEPQLLVGLLTDEFNVTDLDRHGEKDGFKALADMGVECKSRLCAKTAGGGEHHFFAPTPGVTGSNGKIAPGIDIKAAAASGTPGYIVAPGTVAPWGKYEWIAGDAEALAYAIDLVGLPLMPEALIARLPSRKSDREPGEASPTGLPVAVILSALNAIPNGSSFDGRGDWIHIGMALHCETGGSDDGRAAWHEWSKGHVEYDADHTDAAWDSFKTEGGITGWLIIREAERQGWSDPALTELRDMERREEAEADFDAAWDAMREEWGEAETVNGVTAAEIEELVAPVARAGGLTFTTPSQCADLPARPYVIKGLLAERDVAAIVGAPGAGKSLLGPRLGYAVAQGKEVFGRRVRQGGVLYVAAEDHGGLALRLAALRGQHGEAESFELVGGVSDLLNGQIAGKPSPQLEALRSAVEARRPSLVIIDTLAVAFPGLEENSAEGMGRVVAAARSLTEWGAAVVSVHHDTKAGDGLPRGHSLLNGALDVALSLKRDRKGVAGTLTKNRNGSTENGIAFEIGTRVLGIDEDGDPRKVAICKETDTPAMISKSESKLPKGAKAALDHLRDLGHGTRWVPEADWRKACIDGRKVSGSPIEDSRRKATSRAINELTTSCRVKFADGKYHEARSHTETFDDDLPDE
ncbi:AAA family ATPase [Roseisalinus antarcticus]|uniref:Regulatory protein RepA n=1 Tax=Roseisalinus antarcticus TaxID=254357 RepID=A0A1Y5U107_9RHOB|nr:AAA family ATPase [Roseisalinus antarcticus]SLN77648.1 Regulatory protein RepA [Roseisalinus antarcticus]